MCIYIYISLLHGYDEHQGPLWNLWTSVTVCRSGLLSEGEGFQGFSGIPGPQNNSLSIGLGHHSTYVWGCR